MCGPFSLPGVCCNKGGQDTVKLREYRNGNMVPITDFSQHHDRSSCNILNRQTWTKKRCVFPPLICLAASQFATARHQQLVRQQRTRNVERHAHTLPRRTLNWKRLPEIPLPADIHAECHAKRANRLLADVLARNQ